MLNSNGIDHLAALRNIVFSAVDEWNAAHPHPLGSHRERASVSVTLAYADAAGAPAYVIKVVCTLAGGAPLTFHGPDLSTVAEHARLTLEHRIEAETARRADHARDHAFGADYGVAV